MEKNDNTRASEWGFVLGVINLCLIISAIGYVIYQSYVYPTLYYNVMSNAYVVDYDAVEKCIYEGKYDTAIKSLNRALIDRPKDEYAHFWLFKSYYYAGDYGKSYNYYLSTVDIRPDWEHTYFDSSMIDYLKKQIGQ